MELSKAETEIPEPSPVQKGDNFRLGIIAMLIAREEISKVAVPTSESWGVRTSAESLKRIEGATVIFSPAEPVTWNRKIWVGAAPENETVIHSDKMEVDSFSLIYGAEEPTIRLRTPVEKGTRLYWEAEVEIGHLSAHRFEIYTGENSTPPEAA